MKKIIFTIFLLLPFVASGQNVGGMDQAQMQQMMQKMQGMQACMAGINKDDLKAFEQRAKQLGAEVKALCASGNKSEAMAKAMSFGKEAESNSTLQAMKKCGEGMPQMIPKDLGQFSNNSANEHKDICGQTQ
jgi:predicted lipoprotein